MILRCRVRLAPQFPTADYNDARGGFSSMPMHANFISDESRLDLSFSGNLDVSVSQDICAIYNSVPVHLRACIIDLYNIDRLFDSGVALLEMLHRRLVEKDVIVVILSDDSEIRERMPDVTHLPSPFFHERSAPSPIGGSAWERLCS